MVAHKPASASLSSIVHGPSSFVLRPHFEESRTTDFFTIFYPPGEEKTALWYAGFIDEVDRAVSELLGAEPVRGMTLHIYATEPDYWQANPMAELHPGILAHAIPERKEIGVAVERLRQQPPALARESFRHEITHIVAGSLSNQRLPVGFHEGLGQYNELSSTRAQEVVQGLQAAEAASEPYLSWADLNDFARFRQNIEVAYPQSYSVMAFLADRYGMEPFVRFLSGLRDDLEYRHAILLAYGKPMEELEKEWREYLPGFLQDGWKRNVLSANDLGYGLALMGAGQFADAEEHFKQAERLYSDLGRRDRATQASEYLANAIKAKEADQASAQARKDLEAYDYSKAYSGAFSASQAFAELGLPDYQQHADDISLLAQKGKNAITQIEKARVGIKGFDLNGAKASATEAGEAFSALGDAARVAEANTLLSEIWTWQQSIGFGVAGIGVLVLAGVLAGGWVSLLRARKRKARGTDLAATPLLREENQSWL
jgi:tetratricopeptide (TPR) repeat protein